MDTKIFIGRLNTIKTQYGEIITFAISPKDKEIINQYSNNQGWCNISIMTNKKGDKYAQIDTYSLSKEQMAPSSNSNDIKPAKIAPESDDINLDEIPF